MKKLMIAMAVASAVFAASAANEEDAPEGTQKVMLKISTVETVGTRTQKTWNPPSKPMALQELPHSEADLANADPVDAARMIRENRQRKLENQKIQAVLAIDAYMKANAHYEAVKKQLEGTTFGKQVILAVDKFAGAAGEHFDSDCIEFFHRMDNDEGDKEQFLKDMGSTDTLSAPYFIKLIFDNPRIESGKVEMNGQEIKRTKMTIAVTYEVQALNGKVITSGNVKAVKNNKTSNAVAREGADDSMLIDTLEEAIVEVAKRINKHFVAKTTIQLIGPKKDSDFDPDSATIEVDGVQQDAGSEFSIMKGKHTIVVEMEGFKQKGSTTFMIKKDGKIKIALKKEAPKKESEDKSND